MNIFHYKCFINTLSSFIHFNALYIYIYISLVLSKDFHYLLSLIISHHSSSINRKLWTSSIIIMNNLFIISKSTYHHLHIKYHLLCKSSRIIIYRSPLSLWMIYLVYQHQLIIIIIETSTITYFVKAQRSSFIDLHCHYGWLI